ncbi:PrpF domain-containing protein [Kitasatospora cathayae]|uniref:Proline racemase n=1 Tax=Kitasatospora cathayae TaxID=3004092 RepID=A0ABY7PXG8_9ACTN|nr:PrpF domain-containing protein [Kitasatospora sp. HUAS 3-15]WBP85081.1 hypothetical protein O1G21_03940 [Kitasatospora sp. HUAS 3-15]
MIGHFAQAVGAPCPTLVLDAAQLPDDERWLRPVLAGIRRALAVSGAGHVLKFALASPSAVPGFHLDYRFVQGLPGGADRLDFTASCGHSALAVTAVAEEQGWLPPMRPGSRARLRSTGGGPALVCRLDGVRGGHREFTLQFEPAPAASATDLLPTGRPLDLVTTARGRYPASLVSLGNPYVFLDATALHLADRHRLFAADASTLRTLEAIRTTAAERLGRPAHGGLPKIALVGAAEPDGLPVRAVTAGGWHPSVALTGAICLAGAIAVPGTVPHRLARTEGAAGTAVRLLTPAGPTVVTVHATGVWPDLRIERIGIGRKRVRTTGSIRLAPVVELAAPAGV